MFGIEMFPSNSLTWNAEQARRGLEDRGSTTQAVHKCTVHFADLESYS